MALDYYCQKNKFYSLLERVFVVPIMIFNEDNRWSFKLESLIQVSKKLCAMGFTVVLCIIAHIPEETHVSIGKKLV